MDTNVRHTNYGKIKQPLKAPTVYKQTDEALICLTKKKVQLPLRADSTCIIWVNNTFLEL